MALFPGGATRPPNPQDGKTRFDAGHSRRNCPTRKPGPRSGSRAGRNPAAPAFQVPAGPSRVRPPRGPAGAWTSWSRRPSRDRPGTPCCGPWGWRMPDGFPYELRLPLAPYRFTWRDEAAVDAAKDATDAYTQERYTHADGTCTIIREY